MTDRRRGVRRLGLVLGLVALVFLFRSIRDSLPYEPRIYLINDGPGVLKDEAIRSPCGDIPLPELAEGQWLRLDLVPRPGCVYTIVRETFPGEELLRVIELGRRERADVTIQVGIDYVDLDTTTR
ncbi:MAG: hypothetical protein ACYC61_30135 [Isosphaeraceae bacterium]